jgi:hypothetical protein
MGTRSDAYEAALARNQRPALTDGPAGLASWLYDAVDLASGTVHTTPLKRLPPARTRAQHLAAAGFAADLSLLTGPAYRLTPRRPYRAASPQAWLDAFFDSAATGAPDDYFGTYGTGQGVNRIWWRVPPNFPTLYWPTTNFSYAGLAAGPAVMTLRFEAYPYQGATGQVVVYVGDQVVQIPITASAARTVDIGFTHNGDHVLVAMVLLEQGIFDYVFHSVVLHPHATIVHPSPPLPPSSSPVE